MKLAVVESALQVHREDPQELFSQAKNIGLTGIELVLTQADLRDMAHRAGLRQAQQAVGIAFPAVRLADYAAYTEESVRLAIEWAVELQIPNIVVQDCDNRVVLSDDGMAAIVDDLRPLVQQAAENNITVCYESVLGTTTIRQLAETINSEAFGCAVNTAALLWRGMDTVTELLALGDLVKLVHVSDISTEPGDCALGKGFVDFPGSAAALRNIGYDGWIVLDTAPQLPEVLARDVSYIRRCFPQIQVDVPWPRIGVFSYVLDENGDDPVGWAIEQCLPHNITTIQVGGRLLDIALEHPDNALAMRSRFNDAGITVTGIAAYRNLTAVDHEKQRKNIDFMKRCLETAPLLGTSIVATETGTMHPRSDWTGTPENWSDGAWSVLYSVIDELLGVAQANRTILALEGYVNNVLATFTQLEAVIERYPMQNLQVMLDPYNYLSSQLLPACERLSLAFLTRFEHRFILAHLKDVAAAGAEVDTPEFGLGVFPQKSYLEFLRTVRPDLPLVLEHLPVANLAAAVHRVNALIR